MPLQLEIGVSFMLAEQKTPLIILMPEPEAKNIIEGWANRKLPEVIGGRSSDGVLWAARTSSIIWIHTFDPSKVVQQQQQQQQQVVAPGKFYPGTSGVN